MTMNSIVGEEDQSESNDDVIGKVAKCYKEVNVDFNREDIDRVY